MCSSAKVKGGVNRTKQARSRRLFHAQKIPLFRTIAALENMPSDNAADSWSQDYFYKAFSTLARTSKMDSWMLFAAQILWDTQVLLGANIGAAEKELRDTGRDVCRRYEDLTTACTSVEQKEAVKEQVARVKKTAVGSAFQVVVKSRTFGWDSIDASDKTFSLLKNHPALCGIIQADLRDAFHKLSVDVASEAGHILAVAHLYRAAKQTRPRTTIWSAM
jgi:hypothetical protein